MLRSKPLSHKREVYVKKEVIPAPEAGIRGAHEREVLQDSFKNKAVWE
jgi:hypothetical protein